MKNKNVRKNIVVQGENKRSKPMKLYQTYIYGFQFNFISVSIVVCCAYIYKLTNNKIKHVIHVYIYPHTRFMRDYMTSYINKYIRVIQILIHK